MRRTTTLWGFLAALVGVTAVACDDGGGDGGDGDRAALSALYRSCQGVSGCPQQPFAASCRDGERLDPICEDWPSGCDDRLTCDCAGAALCGDRTCVASPQGILCVGAEAPTCGDHDLDDEWTAADGCNRCRCTLYGGACGDEDCAPACGELRSEYEEAIEAAKSCDADADCRVLYVTYSITGIHGQWVNHSVTKEALDALDAAFREADCPGAHQGSSLDMCPVPVEPCGPARCVEGRCAPPAAPGPDPAAGACGAYHDGATWRDGRQLCRCRAGERTCTGDPAPPTSCDEIAARWDALLAADPACATDDDCRRMDGPAWGLGLGPCYAAVADYEAAVVLGGVLEEDWFALGCRRSPPPCPFHVDVHTACDAGRCVLVTTP